MSQKIKSNPVAFLLAISLFYYSSAIFSQDLRLSNLQSMKTHELCAFTSHPTYLDPVNAELCARGAACVRGVCDNGRYVWSDSQVYIKARADCLKNMGAVISQIEIDNCTKDRVLASINEANSLNKNNVKSSSRPKQGSCSQRTKEGTSEYYLCMAEEAKLAEINKKSKVIQNNSLAESLSEEDVICQKNGVKPKTPAFAECKVRVSSALLEKKSKEQEKKLYEDERRLRESEQRAKAEAYERQLATQAQNAKRELETRCNSLRLSAMGQTKSKYWYDSVNAGTEAYERCMMGMPPVERPKPTTTDCQRIGPDNITCTTR